MTRKILRVTRHAPSATQLAELRRAFGDDVQVVTEDIQLPPSPEAAAEMIVAAWEEGGYDEVEIVAPLPVIQSVLDQGVCPLKAVMKSDRGGIFEFVHYERIRRISIVAERLKDHRPS